MPENQKPKVAYVIVGWHNRKLLPKCFKSISEQTYKNALVVYVDNASSDGSVDWVAEKYPEAVVVAQKANTGFSKGNNLGIAEALKDPEVQYVVLLNSDARLDPDWAKNVIKFATLKPKGACFQGTTLDYYNHAVIDSTHIYVSHNGQGTQGHWRYFYKGELGPRKVFGVNAAACLVTRRFLEAQPFGYEVFDETLFMYLEDVDLACRATLMGWDNYLVPGARAYHMGSASSKAKSSSFSLYMTFRNNSGVIFKNFPLRLILRMLPKLIRGDIDTLKTLWRTDRKSHIWAVIKGRLFGILRLYLFIGKRLRLRQHRNQNSDYLWQLMRQGD